MVGKLGRSLVIAILVGLLLISLGAANLTVGVERTVLNEEYVADSLAEEEAYSLFVDEIQKQLEEEAGAATGDGPQIGAVLPEVLTESYLQNQTEANLERAYGYLHGDRADLYLAINTTPLKADLVTALTEQLLSERGIEEFDPTLGAMADNESAFVREREAFKAQQLKRIQDSTEEELSDAELQAVYDDRRAEIRDRLVTELESQVTESDEQAELQPVIVEMGTLRIDALIDEDMTYAEFQSRFEETKAELRDTLKGLIRDQVDQELPDTMELTDQFGVEEREQLEQLRNVVGILDMMVLLLPLIALAAALLIGWLTRTRSGGLYVVGATVTVTGVLTALGFMGVGSRAETEIAAITSQGEMPAAVSELIVALLSKTVGVFSAQSWLLGLLGVAIVLAGFGIRRELLPIADQPGKSSPADGDKPATGVETAADRTSGDPATDVAGESEDLEQESPVESDAFGSGEEPPESS